MSAPATTDDAAAKAAGTDVEAISLQDLHESRQKEGQIRLPPTEPQPRGRRRRQRTGEGASPPAAMCPRLEGVRTAPSLCDQRARTDRSSSSSNPLRVSHRLTRVNTCGEPPPPHVWNRPGGLMGFLLRPEKTNRRAPGFLNGQALEQRPP